MKDDEESIVEVPSAVRCPKCRSMSTRFRGGVCMVCATRADRIEKLAATAATAAAGATGATVENDSAGRPEPPGIRPSVNTPAATKGSGVKDLLAALRAVSVEEIDAAADRVRIDAEDHIAKIRHQAKQLLAQLKIARRALAPADSQTVARPSPGKFRRVTPGDAERAIDLLRESGPRTAAQVCRRLGGEPPIHPGGLARVLAAAGCTREGRLWRAPRKAVGE